MDEDREGERFMQERRQLKRCTKEDEKQPNAARIGERKRERERLREGERNASKIKRSSIRETS